MGTSTICGDKQVKSFFKLSLFVLLCSWLEKVGNWGNWFPGNLVIWREIYEFETKKYIRTVGKYCNVSGKFYHVPGKANIFSSHGCVFVFIWCPHYSIQLITVGCRLMMLIMSVWIYVYLFALINKFEFRPWPSKYKGDINSLLFWYLASVFVYLE